MSTFAVFGMTRHHAFELARKRVKTVEGRGRDARGLTQDEWLEKVHEEAERIFSSTQTAQLSEKFDAPQYAEQFLELARRDSGRNLEMRAQVQDKDRKTGKVKRWWITGNELREHLRNEGWR